MNSQRPRTISELVTIDTEDFHTFLVEELTDKEQANKSLKATGNPYKWAKILTDVLKQVLWNNSNEILPLNLRLLLTSCFSIINSKHQSPDVSKSYIYGLSVIEYNLFLDSSKCEILCLLNSFIASYGSSFYPDLNFILTSSSTAYSLAENVGNASVWQSILCLFVTLLKTYGLSAYDLTTNVLFLAKPNLLKHLLGSLRELIERCDKSVIKKDSKFFTSTEVRGRRQRKQKRLETTYIFAKSDIETSELIHNITSILLLAREYVERCQVLVSKEHRAWIEAVILSIMELSYINTFVELPLRVKEQIFELATALVLFPGTAKAPTNQLLLQLTHFLEKAKESGELDTNRYIVAVQGAINIEASTRSAEIISYKELVVEQNRKLLESFLGNKVNSIEVQTEAIIRDEKAKNHHENALEGAEEMKVDVMEEVKAIPSVMEVPAKIAEDELKIADRKVESEPRVSGKGVEDEDKKKEEVIRAEENKVNEKEQKALEIEDSDSSIDVPPINFN
eukprot:TRINITY_DN7429_c0_g2_i8.p1 TRINITY_DN7429_c0_g2~~TRINITY_DN7429_c0_g2_i8.p1  ORF type:complete len:509 (+),score=64.92 TRINITY_DN7429_c0_g2_i8:394-1920(+)